MSDPPTRRRFRFSLRTMFVLVIFVAIPLAWIARERQQSGLERAIALRLEDRGFNDAQFGGPWDSWELRISGQPQGWWRDLATRALGERVFFLARGAAEVDDLRVFAKFSNLQSLTLSAGHIRDLTPLAGETNLRVLLLGFTQVRDLSPLAGLTRLTNLDLSHTKVKDVTPLSGLTRLIHLDLSNTKINDVTPLHGLTNLGSLNLTNTALSKEQIDALQKALPNCKIQLVPFP